MLRRAGNPKPHRAVCSDRHRSNACRTGRPFKKKIYNLRRLQILKNSVARPWSSTDEISWDLGFGNANYLKGGRTNGWYWNEQDEGMTSTEHIWLRRLLYGIPNIVNPGPTDNPTSVTNSGDPDFIQKMVDRWGQLRTNVVNGSNVTARIDEVASLLSEAAARDFARFPRLGTYIWPNPNGPPSWHVDYQNPRTYQGIIDEMKRWVDGRYRWLDKQFVVAPGLTHPGGSIPPGFSLAMTAPVGTIYYTLDGTDPRAPGGGVAAGAQVYSSAITLDANVLVFARVHHPQAVYPWSPPTITRLYTTIPALRITEIMYHPADPPAGSTNLDADFAYVELKNTGPALLNLNGYRLSGRVDFLFPELLLDAGQYVMVVRNRAAFQARCICSRRTPAATCPATPTGSNTARSSSASPSAVM